MRLLVWNLYHGRAVPPAGRDLLPDFRQQIDAWPWDIAFLQEVPPWWPAQLPGTARDTVLTSRTFPLCLRRPVAQRWPDLIKSNGGGSNAILLRSGAILERRKLLLRRLPERRMVHAVKVGRTWLANIHATAHVPQRATEDVELAVRAVRTWAGESAPIVFAGDLNLRNPQIPGFAYVGGRDVDHVYVRGLRAGPIERLEHGALSDHVPLLATISGG